MFHLILVAHVAWSMVFTSHTSVADSADSSQAIGGLKFYTFTPDDKHCLGDAQAFVLPPSTSVRCALDSLGRHLAKTYFRNSSTGIYFEIVELNKITDRSAARRIAVINMVDKDRVAMGYYFQGSSGARTTFCLLVATFTQPHLTPPLVSGLILLYNGEFLPEMDHIDLSGILIPKSIESRVHQTLHKVERPGRLMKNRRRRIER